MLHTEISHSFKVNTHQHIIGRKLFIFPSIHTPCPQKKYTVCILAITSSNLDQIQKVRWVLKSARSQLFKTVLTFEIWPSRSWENWGQRHQGSFSVFTFFARNYTDLACLITLLDSQNLNLTSQIIFCDIFNTYVPTFNKKKIKKWFLKFLCWNYTEKWLKIT